MSQTQSANPWNATTSLVAIALLAAWAGVAYLTGASGIVTAPPEQIFRPVGLAVVIPVALFVAAYNLAPRFRGFVLAQDLRALTMVQAWRVVGFSFLLLYAADALPALFAFPAGVGDVMIGLTAPFVVLRLTRDAAFARSWRFLAFHAMGLFDFVVAVAAATATSGAFAGLLPGTLTSAAMEVWPLNLFPSLIVPAFIILHLTVFLKVRAISRAAARPVGGALQAA